MSLHFVIFQTRIFCAVILQLPRHFPILQIACCVEFAVQEIALIFPCTRFLKGVCDSEISIKLQLFFLYRFFFRVAPVCVNSSVCIRLWGSFFTGVTPPNREALMLSKEGGGPLNNL